MCDDRVQVVYVQAKVQTELQHGQPDTNLKPFPSDFTFSVCREPQYPHAQLRLQGTGPDGNELYVGNKTTSCSAQGKPRVAVRVVRAVVQDDMEYLTAFIEEFRPAEPRRFIHIPPEGGN